MTQITTGIRSVLSYPLVYSTFQHIMGAHQLRNSFTNEFIKPRMGMRVLDIGCGPADILSYLPGVVYYGYDPCEQYISRAKSTFKKQGNFYSQDLCLADLEEIPPFDVVLAMGLLHHLDDGSAINVLNLALRALNPGGRLLTIDPCFVTGQNPIAKFLIKQDRGRNVPTLEEYSFLAKTVFNSFQCEIRHKKWIPYTHCIMECIAQ